MRTDFTTQQRSFASADSSAAGKGTGRVSLVLKADDRTDTLGTMESKVASIERRLQE